MFNVLAGVGCLTGKNIYQILRRVESVQRFKAAASNARERADNQFAFSGPGSRTCVNVLFSEPGGRGFLRNVNSVQSLRHFSPFVLFLRSAILREMRRRAGSDPLLLEVVCTFESMDENYSVFVLCEAWKVICFLATRDIRYELLCDIDTV